MKSVSKTALLLLLLMGLILSACGSSADLNNSSNNDAMNSQNNHSEAQNSSNDQTGEEEILDEGSGDEVAQTSDLSDFVYPKTEDAFNIVEMEENVLSYQTKYALEDFVEFFNNEMLGQGFTSGYEIIVGDKAVIRFEKAGLAIVANTSQDGEGGFFITIGPQE